MDIKHTAILALALLACSCHDTLRNGDLVFQANESSNFVDAIEAATYNGGLSFSHVGLVYTSDTGIYVIEATPRHGVVATPIEAFLDDSAHDTFGKPLVKYYRAKASHDLADKAVAKALSLIGTPYDFAFDTGTENIYCSELIYECFIGTDGRHLFETQPMNFRDANGNLPAYWVEHFGRLGIPIPENESGTNPNDMARSDKIKELAIQDAYSSSNLAAKKLKLTLP